jgi:hypothetical protein
MNAQKVNVNPPAGGRQPPPPRFDAGFIEEHNLLERYLDDKLPVKGARDLENWCRDNPEYLSRLNLPGRVEASVRLLEACGRPVDLSEPAVPWWKAPYIPVVLGLVTLIAMLGLWALYGKYSLTRDELSDARTRAAQGPLQPPATTVNLQIAPDRTADLGHARIAVNRSAPQLIDLHVDMNYSKAMQFRLFVDKADQGRALILNNLLKDSNGELRLAFNTTGLAAGTYNVRIEALPFRGDPTPEGWLALDVH